MGKLHGISVGSGDPELLTLEAHRILGEADMIFCPEKEKGTGSSAYDIVRGPPKDARAKIVSLVYPTHYHGDRLQEMWEENAAWVVKCLSGNRIGVFITLGDPAVYNTLMYTLLCTKQADMNVEVAPGITSFCAVVDSMKMPLVAWDENLMVAPVRGNSSEDLGRILREHDNVVLMKPFANQQALFQAIRGNHLEDHFAPVIKSDTGEECLVTDLVELEQCEIPYLSTVIIKCQGR